MGAPSSPLRRRTHGLVLLAVLAGSPLAGGCGRSEPGAPPAPPGLHYGLDGALPPGVAPPAERPNVLLIVIDTLRADALTSADGRPPDMPALARRAGRGLTFTQASAASSWTLPSLTSLLTGRSPSEHRITGEEGLTTGLAAGTTWAEVLGRGLGYETVAWFGEGWPVGPGSMFEGFDVGAPAGSLQGVPTLLTYWARRRRAEQPFFALLHTYEAHDPYGAQNHEFPARSRSRQEREEAFALLGPRPAARDLTRALVLDASVREAVFGDPEHAEDLAAFTRYIWSGSREAPDVALAHELEERYRAGVRWVDGILEQALTSFQRAGLLTNTLVIVTGDHGEAFGEHGMLLHGRTLYDELLRVPLVLVGPPPFDRGLALDASVCLTDLMPTVLDWLGVPAPVPLEGRSFLPLVKGGPTTGAAGRPVEAHVVRGPRHTAGLEDALVESVRSAAWKFISTEDRRTHAVREELYDLAADPSERRDLSRDTSALARLAQDTAFSAAVEDVRARRPARAPLPPAGDR